MKENISFKIILISFFVSLNVHVWAELAGRAFYEVILAVTFFIIGLFLYGEMRSGKWRR